MRRSFLAGFIFVSIIFTPALYRVSALSTQESEQFKIENSVILQDINDQPEENDSIQADQRRNTRLGKDGFSALLGETPLRLSVTKTNLDFADSANGIGRENETLVKILYTIDGGYAIYLGMRSGSHTSSVFNATGCSSDMNKCFSTYARPWLDPGVHGFGYTMSGQGTSPDFVDQTYFRPFTMLTTRDPSGVLGAQGQGREAKIKLKTRLNQANPQQGTFLQNVVITVLHDW